MADKMGMLALHEAAFTGQLAAARLLLDAAPHTAAAANQRGESPLFVAACFGHMAVVHTLLDAAPHAALIKTRTGSPATNSLTPLHLASQEGNEELVSG